MTKSILVFGAGLNQLHLIQAVNELGYRSVVIDPSPNAYAKEFAAVFEVVEPKDYIRTREIAQKYNIDGIVTAQMENPLILMAKLANEMGYIFPTQIAVECSRNKFQMKKKFIEHGVPCANGYLTNSIDDALGKEISFPAIIKPADAFSSRGVFKVDNRSQIAELYDESAMWSSDNSVILEEFMEGTEYNIEMIIWKGNVSIVQCTSKLITPYPRTVELAQIQPAILTEEQLEEIQRLMEKTVKSLGLDNCGGCCEIMYTNEGPKVIEMAARLGGDFVSSYLPEYSCGVNMDKALVEVSIGNDPLVTPTKDHNCLVKYLELPVGKEVKCLPRISDITYEGLILTYFYIKEGDRVSDITHSATRSGFIIVQADSYEEMMRRMQLYENEIISMIEFKD